MSPISPPVSSYHPWPGTGSVIASASSWEQTEVSAARAGRRVGDAGRARVAAAPDLLLRRVVLTELVDVRTGDQELKERVQALRRSLGRRFVPGRSPVHGDHFHGGQERATPIGELRRRGRYHPGGRRGEPADTAHRDDANGAALRRPL